MGRRSFAAGGGLAAALLIATPFIAKHEGKRNDPYLDIAKVPTVCYGETRVVMKRYTDQECLDMFEKAVEEFAEPLIEDVPSLAFNPYQLAAATSLVYNIGQGAWKGSSVRKKFKAGDYRGACNGFYAWRNIRVKGKLVESKGLVNRRKDETKLCLTGL